MLASARDRGQRRAGTLCDLGTTACIPGCTPKHACPTGRECCAGVCADLLKDAEPMELHLAIHSVMEGKVYLSPAVTRHVLRPGRDEETVGGGLTSRQKEIVQLLAEGHSVKEIAKTLELSVKTVETHRAQVMQRLDIHDLAGLVRYASRKGLVQVGE